MKKQELSQAQGFALELIKSGATKKELDRAFTDAGYGRRYAEQCIHLLRAKGYKIDTVVERVVKYKLGEG